MLELRNLSLSARRAGEDVPLLQNLTARFPRGHLCAIVGPSGCGKSTLLKAIAGIRLPDEGGIHWEGRNLEEQDLEPQQIGYVPQFSIAFEDLTVAESIETALALRVGGLSGDERRTRTELILIGVGLEDIPDRRVRVLSGGQRRRLSLAIELASTPVLLLCDEVTSGLDPKAESEITRLLRALAEPSEEEPRGRLVLTVTHSLRHLAEHDSVLVMYAGSMVFHGPPALLLHYFGLQSGEELFPHLERRAPDQWRSSWEKYRDTYEANLIPADTMIVPLSHENPSLETTIRPGRLTQFRALMGRRWRIFRRQRGQLALQLALLLGFPCLVVIFAWDGLPQIQNLTNQGNAVQQLLESASHAIHTAKVAGLVSGLVMFQVILLTLMASNNSSREIAEERAIFEKEKFSGLHPSSYVASKALFLACIVTVQSVWMAIFVSAICRFPGDLATQVGTLWLVNAGMTALCLGISSLARSAEQASLIGVYLVGFQLPLSGAVLALPRVIGWLTQPFIAAYWGWSGYLQTMRDTRFYDAVQSASRTDLGALTLCQWVLGFHIAGGLLLAYLGCKNSRWE